MGMMQIMSIKPIPQDQILSGSPYEPRRIMSFSSGNAYEGEFNEAGLFEGYGKFHFSGAITLRVCSGKMNPTAQENWFCLTK